MTIFFTNYERNRLIGAMYEESITYHYGVGRGICDACGCRSKSLCGCSKRSFYRTVTDSQIQNYFDTSKNCVVESVRRDRAKQAEAKKLAQPRIVQPVTRSNQGPILTMESELRQIDELLANKVSKKATLIAELSQLSGEIEKDELLRIQMLNDYDVLLTNS